MEEEAGAVVEAVATALPMPWPPLPICGTSAAPVALAVPEELAKRRVRSMAVSLN